MIIGGLQKFSLLDYPNHLSAIIFTQGCNFRCQYCYNPMLVVGLNSLEERGSKQQNIISLDSSEDQKGHPMLIEEDDLFEFLKDRKNKLDAVVVTGGEPTAHDDLVDFIIKIKKLGYKIKLDTNGTNPDILKELIEKNLLDYIAMDIKAPGYKYDLITGTQPEIDKLLKSINLIIESGLPHEFRTTIVPELISKEDIVDMGKMIKGGKKWFLQQFKSDTALVNEKFEQMDAYSSSDLEEMLEIAREFIKESNIR